MDKVACMNQGGCPRSGKGPMVAFPMENRKSRIRVVVLSQDPSSQLYHLSDQDSLGVERHLQNECMGRIGSPRRMITQLHDILGRKFDPFDDAVYWTHSIKCVPRTKGAIYSDWSECSSRCIKNLKAELRSISENELVIVALGAYATGMALAIINGLDRPRKMTALNKFIIGLGSEAAKEQSLSKPKFEQPHEWEGKTLYLTSFVLSTHEEQVLSDGARKVQAEEMDFIQERMKGHWRVSPTLR